MSSSINQVVINGYLGQDPDIRSTQSGNRVATLSVATGESWKDRNTGEKKEKTEWHRVVVWTDWLVDLCDTLKKGDRVHVIGKLQTRKWQDKDGKDRYSTEIVVQGYHTDLMKIVKTGGGSRRDGDPGPSDADSRYGAAPGSAAGKRQELDDEIPF